MERVGSQMGGRVREDRQKEKAEKKRQTYAIRIYSLYTIWNSETTSTCTYTDSVGFTIVLCSYLFSQGRVVTTNRMGNGSHQHLPRRWSMGCRIVRSV